MASFELTNPADGAVFKFEGVAEPTTQEEVQALLSQATGQAPPPAAPEAAQAPQDDAVAVADSAILKVAEPALTFATSALAEPLAGLAGIFGTIFGSKEGEGAENVEATRKALTFQPRSEAGKIGLQAVAENPVVEGFVDILTKGEKMLGDAGFKIAGPAGGAFGASVPTAVLELLGVVSLKNLRLGKSKLIDPKTGKPSAELQKALDESGTSFDDLSPEAIEDLKGVGQVRGDVPGFGNVTKIEREAEQATEAARVARFQSEGIPFTKGDVSQDFVKQADEQRLLSMTGDAKSEPLRNLKLQQSQAFIKKTNELADSLGGTAADGEILKGALDGRLKLLKKEKNELYKTFSETSPELKNVPILTDTLVDALPDRATVRRIERSVPGPGKALDELQVEFGINKDPTAVDAFLKAGDEITPLNIGNIDDFRQGINLIERSDQTGSIKVLTGPIKRALDAEADLVDSAARAAGITDESLLAPLKEARKVVREIKTEFSPESITGKLIKVKKDGVTPVVEASKAFNEVLAPNKPIEFLQRTMDTLEKSGPAGRKAIESMQAATILKALDDALKAPTRKTGGIETIGANQFDVSLRKFGDDKLKLLFRSNPGALKRLKKLQAISKDIVPSSTTTLKGSSPVLLDLAKKLQRTPGLSKVFDFVFFALENDRKAVNAAVNARPTFSKAVKLIKEDFPNLAVQLGIGKLSGDVEKEKNKKSISIRVDKPGTFNPETGLFEE